MTTEVDLRSLVNSLKACGFEHVHTWEESHGQEFRDIYQSKHGGTIEICRYVTPRTFGDSLVRAVSAREASDYLGAREVKADEDWIALGAETISPCCTSGHQDYRHRLTGEYYRIIGVAGHGEWRVPLTVHGDMVNVEAGFNSYRTGRYATVEAAMGQAVETRQRNDFRKGWDHAAALAALDEQEG